MLLRLPISSSTAQPALRERGKSRVFWGMFYLLAALLTLIMVRNLGRLAPGAIILQLVFLVWLIAIVLRQFRHRLTYAIAAFGIALVWVPLSVQVVARIHHWVTIGMDAADGQGSPLAFLIGFIFEQVVFLSLTALLFQLPWRNLIPQGQP